MWGMAARLSDPTIEGVAAYYAAQPSVAGTPGASPGTIAGAKIFAEGIPAAGTPACMGCHGEKAAGNGPIRDSTGLSRASIGSVCVQGAGQRDHAREFEEPDA